MDAVVGRARLVSEADDVVSLRRIPLRQRLAEAMPHHAVADDDHGARLGGAVHASTPPWLWITGGYGRVDVLSHAVGESNRGAATDVRGAGGGNPRAARATSCDACR
jgi:hypothetical protein